MSGAGMTGAPTREKPRSAARAVKASEGYDSSTTIREGGKPVSSQPRSKAAAHPAGTHEEDGRGLLAQASPSISKTALSKASRGIRALSRRHSPPTPNMQT